jgi:tol-pal system protein YbgF
MRFPVTERARLSLTGLVLIVGTGAGLAGCADLMPDDALQQDVAQLRQDVNTLKLGVHRERGEAETLSQLERRSREQAAENTKQLDALSTRLDALGTELGRLSAKVDQVSERVAGLTQQARATPAVPPAPPRSAPPASEQATARPATGTPAVAEARPPRVPVEAPSSIAAGAGDQAFQAASRDFTRGHYELAIPGFREFVRRFPDSPLADSAQYKIGESYLNLARDSGTSRPADQRKGDLERAVQEFRKVIVNYPTGSKVPAALYKEALALTELKQVPLAQARLQYLVDHFPQSEEAPLARERLAALKQ